MPGGWKGWVGVGVQLDWERGVRVGNGGGWGERAGHVI